MIRFIAIFLLFVSFIPLFLFPASAAFYVADQNDVIDFLSSYSYSAYKGGAINPSFLYNEFPIPEFYASGSAAYCFSWISPSISSCSSLNLTILATTQPSSVGFLNSETGVNFRSFSYVGFSSGVNGLNRYYYRFDNPTISNVNFGIRVVFSSSYSGTLGIESFIGYAANVYGISFADYNYYRVYSARPDNAASDGFRWVDYGSGTDTLSTFFLDEFWWGEDPSEYREPLRFDAFYKIDLSAYPVLSRAHIRFYCLGLDGDISVSLVDETGNIAYAVPDFTISNSVSTSYFNTNFATFDVYNYFLSVDLSGYDLTGLYLQFKFSTPYLMASSVEELSYAYGGLYDVAVFVPVVDRPWYAGVVDFLKDILETFMNIVRTLTNWVIDLYNECIAFFDNLMLTINENFMWFTDWAGDVISSLTGTEEDQQEAEQFEQEANKSNQDLNDLSGKMDAVDRPDIDNINISVDSYIPADGITLLTSPFNIVFGNGYIFKILSVSLIMALVSYVLFGKR